MSSQPLDPAQWESNEDGRIYAPGFGDVYASRAGAWGQAQAVFIKGCQLPQRWYRGEQVRLLETGFGLGVNFLASWAALERCMAEAKGRGEAGSARLDYLAIEKHPFTRDDLRTALSLSIAAAPEEQRDTLQALADRLIALWPPMLRGFHALELDERVTLTLVFDDVDTALSQVTGRFDAIYLDGFAPDRNPVMWSPVVLSQVAALAAPGALLASWCVAGAVRRALADAGFRVEKRPGYGGKRDCLSAQWPQASEITARHVGSASDVSHTSKVSHSSEVNHSSEVSIAGELASVVVVGAGIAGASIARQLARRGLRVTVLERDRPACGGSGNPAGVVRPEPGSADNPITTLSAAGVTWLMRWIDRHAAAVPHHWCGVLRIARDERKRDKMARQAVDAADEWLQGVDLEAARSLCGAAPAEAGFHLPQAGWVVPPALVAAFLDHPGITLQTKSEVKRLQKEGAGWQLLLADGSRLQATRVVLATAFDHGLGSTRLAMGSARGQLSMLAARDTRALHKIVCRDGYITPAVNGMHIVGATVQHDDDDAAARTSDDEQNFERLQRLLPDFATRAELQSGRVGWRATTPDRLPLVGKLDEGLYASLGHGARGITCAPLCAEFLAAMMCDAPLPLGAEWIARLDPLRREVKDA